MSAAVQPRLRILVINPNTSQFATEALRPVVESLGFDIECAFFTCPAPGVESINGPEDATQSAKLCLPHLRPLVSEHDAFLVACYSSHPLNRSLKQILNTTTASDVRVKHVLGIFEASVVTSLALIPLGLDTVTSTDAVEVDSALEPVHEGFGIVSTCTAWKEPLEQSVAEMLGSAASKRFVGTETTGYSASELHHLPFEQVKVGMMQATARLIQRGRDRECMVSVICLGCANMAGMEMAVREACVMELGVGIGGKIKVVDGVKAGIGALVALSKSGY